MKVMQRVRAGAALLDRKFPGWENKIDLATLDLGACGLCVIGQACGRYQEHVVSVLGLPEEMTSWADETNAVAAERGFLAPSVRNHGSYWQAQANREYRILTRAWAAFIKNRIACNMLRAAFATNPEPVKALK